MTPEKLIEKLGAVSVRARRTIIELNIRSMRTFMKIDFRKSVKAASIKGCGEKTLRELESLRKS